MNARDGRSLSLFYEAPATAKVVPSHSGCAAHEDRLACFGTRPLKDYSVNALTESLRPRPLDGVRILDLTQVLSGPYATALLADLGATVVKVEPPDGDDYRRVGPFKDGESVLFNVVNRNKLSVVLDLKTKEGMSDMRQLVSTADVLVENFRPGVANRLGLGHKVLCDLYPKLVYVSISGFGHAEAGAGPAAYDAVIQGMTGLMVATGDPMLPPTMIGEALADVAAGAFAALGVMAALLERTKSGKGQFVDVAMLDSHFSMLPTLLSRYLATSEAPMRAGNRHATSAPFGLYKADDDWIIIAVLNERLFAALCKAITREDLAADPRFATDAKRSENEGLLREEIERWSRKHAAAECLLVLSQAGVPSGPVWSMKDLMLSTWATGRGLTEAVLHPHLRSIQLPQQPVRFSAHSRPVPAVAPSLGQHNEELLNDRPGRAAT